MTIIGLIAAASKEPWTADALCQETDPEIFFPIQGGNPIAAKLICRACRVRAECLEFAVRNNEGYGIWGGLTEKERRGLKHERKAPTPLRCRNGHPRDTSGGCRRCAHEAWLRYKARKRAGIAK